jgi:hypothetical protein
MADLFAEMLLKIETEIGKNKSLGQSPFPRSAIKALLEEVEYFVANPEEIRNSTKRPTHYLDLNGEFQECSWETITSGFKLHQIQNETALFRILSHQVKKAQETIKEKIMEMFPASTRSTFLTWIPIINKQGLGELNSYNGGFTCITDTDDLDLTYALRAWTKKAAEVIPPVPNPFDSESVFQELETNFELSIDIAAVKPIVTNLEIGTARAIAPTYSKSK